MSIFAIIVTYNGMRRDWIQKCFSSLEASTVPVQIIAVDNASTDNSVPFIKEKFPNVLLIESKENLGFGGANNVGLRKALELGGDYFFLLNQDAWVEPNTVEKLVQQAENNQEYGIISPLHFNGNGDRLDLNFSVYISEKLCPYLISDFALGKVKDKLYELSFVNAAAWLLSKETLRCVGGFSRSFFHYAEDDNYCQRVLHKQKKIGIYPHVKIYHDRVVDENFVKNESFLKSRMILKFSNPNEKQNIKEEIHYYQKTILKNILKFNFGIVKEQYQYLQRMKKQKTVIEENNKLSVSDKEYTFIL